VLLGVIFVTFSFQFFQLTAPLVALLRLGHSTWRYGFLWQALTYPFAGFGGPSLWFLLELLILFWFGRDVFHRLGRRQFWTVVMVGAAGGAVVALAVEAAGYLAGFGPAAIVLLQGQRTLLVVFITCFAVLFADATIYLFFVLPVRARWFVWIEILFAFMAYLGSRDLAGFLGVCATVATVWLWLRGGLSRGPREMWLRLQRWWLEQRLRRLRRQRGFTVIPGDKGGGGGPYLN
jgi:hypothetical protein